MNEMCLPTEVMTRTVLRFGPWLGTGFLNMAAAATRSFESMSFSSRSLRRNVGKDGGEGVEERRRQVAGCLRGEARKTGEGVRGLDGPVARRA